jgi:hypothetical protein
MPVAVAEVGVVVLALLDRVVAAVLIRVGVAIPFVVVTNLMVAEVVLSIIKLAVQQTILLVVLAVVVLQPATQTTGVVARPLVGMVHKQMIVETLVHVVQSVVQTGVRVRLQPLRELVLITVALVQQRRPAQEPLLVHFLMQQPSQIVRKWEPLPRFQAA